MAAVLDGSGADAMDRGGYRIRWTRKSGTEVLGSVQKYFGFNS